MEQAGLEAQHDGDSYNFVIVLCGLDKRIALALKHMQSMYERGFVPSKSTYNELLVACAWLDHTWVAAVVLKELKVSTLAFSKVSWFFDEKRSSWQGTSLYWFVCTQTHQLMPQMQTVAELVFAAVEVDDA